MSLRAGGSAGTVRSQAGEIEPRSCYAAAPRARRALAREPTRGHLFFGRNAALVRACGSHSRFPQVETAGSKRLRPSSPFRTSESPLAKGKLGLGHFGRNIRSNRRKWSRARCDGCSSWRNYAPSPCQCKVLCIRVSEQQYQKCLTSAAVENTRRYRTVRSVKRIGKALILTRITPLHGHLAESTLENLNSESAGRRQPSAKKPNWRGQFVGWLDGIGHAGTHTSGNPHTCPLLARR